MIFASALPLEWMLDPSLHCGPNSAWCYAMAMKRSLTLVCKHWSSVMVKFLYRDIVIRRTPQLFRLAETIATNPNLGKDVRNFKIQCYVQKQDAELVTEALANIWAKCPKLAKVSRLLPFEVPVRYTLPMPPASVTSLTIGPGETADFVSNLLQASCGQLHELSLPATDSAEYDLPLDFPKLKNLHVAFDRKRGEDNSHLPSISTFATKWSMPELKRLRITTTMDYDCHFVHRDYAHLLRYHGKRLEYLEFPNLHSHWIILRDDILDDYEPHLRRCENLKHVVLPMHHVLHSVPTSMSGDRVQEYLHGIVRVDIWHTDIHDEQQQPWLADVATAGWPFSLRKFGNCPEFRYIDVALATHVEGIAQLIGPDERGTWSCPGMELSQDHEDGLLRLKLADLPAVNHWESSYFGEMESHAVARDQVEDVLDDDDLTLLRADGMNDGRPLPVVDTDDLVLGELEYYRPSKWETFLEDETDDEDTSDLVSENLGDLDEFYEREDASSV
ncbi:hypothetical protein C8F01DRAFT_1162849 [Mycena amicta]|nr:hypothetical protein C8F01DRAFT_1162849 [Mycena amicta]